MDSPTEQNAPITRKLPIWQAVIVILLAVAAWTLVHEFGSHQAKSALANISISLLGLSVFLHILSIFFKGTLWYLIIRATPMLPRIKIREVFSPLCIGFLVNGIFIARAGEFVKSWLMRAYLQQKTENNQVIANSTVLGTISLEQFLLSASFCVLLIILLPFVFLPTWMIHALYILTSITIIGGLTIFLIEKRRGKNVDAPTPESFRKLTRDHGRLIAIKQTIITSVQAMQSSWKIIHSPMKLILAIATGALVWAFQFLGTWALLRAFVIDADWQTAVALVAASSLISIAPVVPGNIGVFPAVCTLVLTLSGIDPGLAFLISVTIQIVESGLGIVLGFIALTIAGLKLQDLRLLSKRGQDNPDSNEV